MPYITMHYVYQRIFICSLLLLFITNNNNDDVLEKYIDNIDYTDYSTIFIYDHHPVIEIEDDVCMDLNDIDTNKLAPGCYEIVNMKNNNVRDKFCIEIEINY